MMDQAIAVPDAILLSASDQHLWWRRCCAPETPVSR